MRVSYFLTLIIFIGLFLISLETVNAFNGVCGPADGFYTVNDTWFDPGWCSAGAASGAPSGFPDYGTTVYWNCLGGGAAPNEDADCSATRQAATTYDGACGPAAKTYSYTEESFDGSLCSEGARFDGPSGFPDPGTSVSWKCAGGGVPDGSDADCSASRLDLSPSCSGYNKTVDSGSSVATSVSTENATKIEWDCSDFSVSGGTATYSEGVVISSSTSISKGETISSTLQYVNNSGSTKKRICDYTVWKLNEPIQKNTCRGTVTVNPAPVTAPTLSFSADPTTVDLLGSTTLSWNVKGASSCKASGAWSGVKPSEDSKDYQQVIGDDFTTTGIKTYYLECWNSIGESSGKMKVDITVEQASVPSCLGYDKTVFSGNSMMTSVVTAGDVDRISWDCTNFILNDNTATYTGISSVSNALDIEMNETVFSNYVYINNSGSTKRRECNFEVWNSLRPENKGSCSGTVTVLVGNSDPASVFNCLPNSSEDACNSKCGSVEGLCYDLNGSQVGESNCNSGAGCGDFYCICDDVVDVDDWIEVSP